MSAVLINELNLIENFDILFKKKIIIYSAGSHGVNTYKLLKRAGISIKCFCDSDFQKCGHITIDNMEIISPAKLKAIDAEEDILIIIASSVVFYIDSILQNIIGLQLRSKDIFTAYGLKIALAQNINDKRLNKEYRDASYCNLIMHTIAKYDHDKYIHGITAAQYMENIDQILVYNPYKVGSYTIHNSLNQIGIENSHIHFLSDRIYSKDFIESQSIDVSLNRLYDTLKSKNDKIKIISLVREPISRDFSWMIFYIKVIGINYVMTPGESFVESCNKWFKSRLDYKQNKTDWLYIPMFDWFDQEIKAVFGIDVIEYPFDKEKGYSIIEKDNIELLLLKLEKLNSLESIIGEFVGAPHFKLITGNDGESEPHKYLYKNMRDVIKIPYELISFYYENNPCMDHFYSDAEKKEFLKKWENNFKFEVHRNENERNTGN